MEEQIQKITNAVYKLLDFFPETDPLKNKAKEKALEVLEGFTLLYGIKGWVSFKTEKDSDKLIRDIEILLGYLNIAKYQGWVDSMNLIILSKEYEKIRNEIRPSGQLIKREMEIMKDFKEVAEKPVLITKQEVAKPITLIVKEEKVLKPQPEKQTKSFTDRQDKIIKLLKDKEKAQVSDILKVLPNITKRTIRRDLDDLLKKGEVVRQGEWNQIFYKLPGRVN